MSTNPKDIDLFDLGRLGSFFGSYFSADMADLPCIDYWLDPKEGISIFILFDNQKSFRLALIAARIIAAGGVVTLNGEHLNAAYFHQNFYEILDLRGASSITPGSALDDCKTAAQEQAHV